MAPVSELLGTQQTYFDDDQLFSSWPGPFDPSLDSDFGNFPEAVPSCTGSCPADFGRKVVASRSFSSEPGPARLQTGRSLSSELTPAAGHGEVDTHPKKLTAAERKLQSNRKVNLLCPRCLVFAPASCTRLHAAAAINNACS